MESSAMEGEEYYNPEGSEWRQKVDTGQLCRVCANANEYLIPIFDGEGLEHELGMKIQKHLPIKVTETDSLPLQMCYQCASTLIAWHDLVISCLEADKKLRELQVEEEGDDDDKGAEMFESPSLDSEVNDDTVQPSTSETQNQVSKSPSPKKTSVSKEKKPKLKMVLVKGPPAGTSGQKSASKTSVAKALELAKSKDGASQDSASERYSWSSWVCMDSFSREVLDENKSNKEKEFHQIMSDHSYHIQQNDTVSRGSGTCRERASRTDDGTVEERCEEHDGETEETAQDISVYSESKISEEDTELSKRQAVHIICVKARSDCTEVPQNLTSTIYACKVCDKTYINNHDYELHLVNHSAERMYLCQMCGKNFRFKSSFVSHLKTHCDTEVIKKYICDMCGKRFKSVTLLQTHMVTHTGEKSFTCGTCGKSFSSRSNLKYHAVSHSEQRPHGCDVCGKLFKRKSNLKEHQARHVLDKDNPCHICNSSFPSVMDLVKHVSSHTGEEILENETLLKTVQCDMCCSSFSSLSTLTLHMESHYGETLYSCHTCKKHFRSQKHLDTHAKMHVVKKFVCKMCGKKLALRKTLVEHERIHTGERPFCCSACGRRFRYLSGLHAHRALHSEQRPYACTHCDAQFRRRTYLVGHLRTHTGEKPHVCDICKRSFAQRSDMVKHRARHNK